VVVNLHLILQRKIVNKVFRSALTGVISVGMFSALSVAPAQAYTPDTNPTSQISLTGTPAVGSVLSLTKQIYSWSDLSFAVTWVRCNSAISLSNKQSDFDALLIAKTCSVISQSKSTTYTVTSSDVGKHITGAVYMEDFLEEFPPQNSKWGISTAKSLLIAGQTSTGGGTKAAAPALPAQKLVKALPAKAKARKSITIAAATKSKVAVTVKVKGKDCKVTAVKDKKNKKKIASYKVKMGKKGMTCTVTVTAPKTSKVAAFKLVKKIKAT